MIEPFAKLGLRRRLSLVTAAIAAALVLALLLFALR